LEAGLISFIFDVLVNKLGSFVTALLWVLADLKLIDLIVDTDRLLGILGGCRSCPPRLGFFLQGRAGGAFRINGEAPGLVKTTQVKF
jgi:hypothetical protein